MLVPSRRLDNRIRELCAKATATDTVNVAEVLSELQSSLHEHAQEMRKLASQEIARQRERRLLQTEDALCDWTMEPNNNE